MNLIPIAEMNNVHQQQRNVQVILDSITFSHSSERRQISTTLEVDPQYENVNEAQLSSIKNMEVVECVAYASIPAHQRSRQS